MEAETSVEIKNYARILWHWSWLVVGLPAVVVAVSLLRAAPPGPTGYTASMRFSIGLLPEAPAAPAYSYDGYYTWMTAEYLADDLTEIVKSGEVAQAVMAEAQRRGLSAKVTPGAIQGATSGGKLHRIVTVSINWPDQEELAILAESVATVLQEGKAGYFAQYREAGTPVMMHLIDPPTLSPVGASTRQRLDLPLRLLLAVFAGVGGAFMLEYLDDTIHGPGDLQARDMDVLGTIPRRSSLPWIDRSQR